MYRSLVRSSAILLTGWTLACVLGFGYLWAHSHREGERDAAPASWPAESEIDFSGDCRQALVFIHPHCPCTRATLAELRRTVAASPAPVRIVIVAVEAGLGAGTDSANVALARSIPGTEIYPDEQGAEAARFGAKTSGYVLLYAADGRLQFQGGVTSSRGHEGPSAGATAIGQILAGDIPTIRATPVFGCALPTAFAPTTSANPASRTPRL